MADTTVSHGANASEFTAERPYEPALCDVQSNLKHASECLELLLRECAPELARMPTDIEETPDADGEMPESGLTRCLRALDVVSRALAYVEEGQANVALIEAAHEWDAVQGSEVTQ